MTDFSVTLQQTAARTASLASLAPSPLKQPDHAQPMSAAAVATLLNAIESSMASERRAPAQEPSQPLIQLRAPDLTTEDASKMVQGVLATLPQLLSTLVWTYDQMATEEGADLRAAEGAAQVQPRDVPTVPRSEPGVAGAEKYIRAMVWIESSSITTLLTLLRQVLLLLEKEERQKSADMVTMSRESTIRSTDHNISKAKDAVTAAGIGLGVGAALGGWGMKKSYQSTSVQTGSTIGNVGKANKTDLQVHDARGEVKAHSTPSDLMRPARSVDGTPAARRNDGGRASADLQADADVDLRSMNPTASEQKLKSEVDIRQRAHAENMAVAQNHASQALLFNSVAQAGAGVGQAGGNIAVAMEESAAQLAQNDAETKRKIADGRQEQATKNAEARASTDQVIQTFLSMMSDSSGRIIANF